MNTFNQEYRFRPTTIELEGKKRKNGLTGEQLVSLVQAGTFEEIKEGEKVSYKRKPVTVSLNFPAELASIDDPLLVDLIKEEVAAYVKDMYIDTLLSIGSHTWAEIKAWREDTGRQSSSAEAEFTDQDATKCADIFAAYWNAQGDSKKPVGQLFASLCTAKCAWREVKSLIVPKGKTITQDLVLKYRDKFQELSNGLKEGGQPEEAALMQILTDKLSKYAETKFEVQDAASSW